MDNQKNIYKWNEITYNSFIKIFNSFTKRENWTLNKVLEIQDPSAISNNIVRRLYIGDGIKTYNFSRYSNPFISLLKIIDPKNELNYINSLKLFKDQPIIVPLLSEGKFIDIYFGNSKKSTKDILGSYGNSVWYIKENDIILIDNNKARTDNERLIRVRTIDLNYWKKIIDNYLKNGVLSDCEEDLKKENIKIKE